MNRLKQLNHNLFFIAAFFSIINICIVINQYININRALDDEILSIVDSVRELEDKLDMILVCNIKSIPDEFTFVENTSLEYLVRYTKYYTEEGKRNIEWIDKINDNLTMIIKDDVIDNIEVESIKSLKSFTSEWLVLAEDVITKSTGDMLLNKDIYTTIGMINNYNMDINHAKRVNSNAALGEYDIIKNFFDDFFKEYFSVNNITFIGNKIDINNNTGQFKLYDKYYIDTSIDYVKLFQITKYATTKTINKDVLMKSELDIIADDFIKSFGDLKLVKRTIFDKKGFNGIIYSFSRDENQLHNKKPLLIYIDKYGYIGGVYYPYEDMINKT